MKTILPILLLLGNTCFAVVDGRLLTKKEILQFGAFVSLGEDRNISGGVHIGDGLILTAEHVFYPIHSKISIQDINGISLGQFSFQRETQVVTPKPIYGIEANIPLQIPDLAILIPPKNIRDNIRKLPVATLQIDKPKVANKNFTLVGVGQIDYDETPNPKPLIPRLGKFQPLTESVSNTPDTFSTQHNAEKKWSGGAPGDSGSPLWATDGEQTVVIGVAHLIYLEEGAPAETVFTKIDSAYVQSWFTELSLMKISKTCASLAQ